MTLRNYFRLLAEDRAYGKLSVIFWSPFLFLSSLIYRLGLFFHQKAYQIGILKKESFEQPVISVGNLTWGGTGKTPLVEYIARFYINRGNVPLILSRGYGKDETNAIAKQLPEAKLAIGANRYKAAKKILAETKIDIIILDDGFQHWPINRNLNIVAVNVLNPFGNKCLIPKGILREPLGALKRADVVVLTDVNLASRKELEALKGVIRRWAPRVEFVEAYREALYFYRPGQRERIQPNRLEGERVTTFSGIGTPRSFQMLLHQVGIKTIRNFEFSDHHKFSERELSEINEAKELSKSDEIITTEKDFFRAEEAIRKTLNPLVLKARLHLTTGETTLHQYLARFTRPRSFNREQNRHPHDNRRQQRKPFHDKHQRQHQHQHHKPSAPIPPKIDEQHAPEGAPETSTQLENPNPDSQNV